MCDQSFQDIAMSTCGTVMCTCVAILTVPPITIQARVNALPMKRGFKPLQVDLIGSHSVLCDAIPTYFVCCVDAGVVGRQQGVNNSSITLTACLMDG